MSELAIRWWYCLPEWPPADFDYEAALNKQGYRLVGNDKFRIEENLVDGLLKATPIDGYVGIYKTKTVTVNLFRNSSMSGPKRHALLSISSETKRSSN